MKTSEIKLLPIDNQNHVDLFFECVDKEKSIFTLEHADWVGCNIYDIYVGNQHCGFISYDRWGSEYCLSCVYILEQHRGKGIATATIRKVLNELKHMTNNFVYGFVEKDNKKAISMYEKIGCRFLSKSRFYTELHPSEDKCILDDGFYEFAFFVRR